MLSNNKFTVRNRERDDQEWLDGVFCNDCCSSDLYFERNDKKEKKVCCKNCGYTKRLFYYTREQAIRDFQRIDIERKNKAEELKKCDSKDDLIKDLVIEILKSIKKWIVEIENDCH